MSSEAQKFGRVAYVEPTNIIGNSSVRNEDFINHPYEDYCISVDLSVRIANRYSCGFAGSNGNLETLHWSTDNGTISFLKGVGPNGDLTTEYTDVKISDPTLGDTSECLGMKSIHIQYNSWMYPEVTIEFVDVMGASVMGPEEYDSYRMSGDTSSTKSLYHALFSFPYPMFILKVKGFYGQGVTYKLAVRNTKMAFDANTGNFNITVQFIGYMYGVYTDMPMTLLSVAPYTDFGKKYWIAQSSDGAFKYKERDGSIGNPMLTFPEFRYKVAAAATSEEYTSIARGMDSATANIQAQQDELNEIKRLSPINSTIADSDMKFTKSRSGKYIGISPKNDIVVEKDYEKRIQEFNKAVNKYTEKHGTEDAIIHGEVVNKKEKTEVKGLKESDLGIKWNISVDNVVCTLTTTKNANGEEIKEWEVKGKNLSQNDIEDIKETLKNGNHATNTVNVSLLDLGNANNEYLDVIDRINKVSEDLDKRKDALKEDAKNREAALIEKALGFRPSVQNIFEMAFAHMETFIQGMGEMLNNIANPSEPRNRDRRMIENGDNTDVPINTYAPPFFKMFVKNPKTNADEEVYFDKFSKFSGNELEEDVYVKSLLEGAQLYIERMDEVEKSIQALTSQESGTSHVMASDAPTISCANFVPLTVFDMVNKDKMLNPYKHIKKMCEKNQDITLATFAAVALRGFYYMCTNSGVKEHLLKSDDAKLLGKIEALNFYKAVGKKINSNFVNFIDKYGDGWWERSESAGVVSDLCSKSNEGYRSLWPSNQADFGESLFKMGVGGEDGTNIKLNMQAGEYAYLPIGTTNFNDILSDYGSHNLMNFEGYIPTNGYKIGKLSEKQDKWGILSGKTTFHIYEDRDYIKNLYNNIKAELQTAVGTGSDCVFSSKEIDRIMELYKKYVRADLNNSTLLSNDKPGLFDVGDGGIISKTENKSDGTIDWKDETETRCEIKSVGQDDIKKLISEGTIKDWESVFVKYPGIYNENFDEPVFFSKAYTSQKSLEAKAYMFLFSTPLVVDNDDNKGFINTLSDRVDGGNGGIVNEVRNGVTFKLRLLREGAVYWREYMYQTNEEDPINFEGVTNNKPDIREVPVGKTVGQVVFGSRYETLKLESGQLYDKWEEPRGTTPSRKITLRKFFKEWVISDFRLIDDLATRTELYGEEDNGKKNASRGLNGVYVYTTKRNDLTILQARQLQEVLRRTFFSPCITMDYYYGVICDGNKDYESNFNGCSYRELKVFIRGFMDGLEQLYKPLLKKYKDDKGGTIQEITSLEATDPFKNYDIKLSLYQTLCSLYNKWLCTADGKGLNTWKLGDTSSDFHNFQYVDTFYNKIGTEIMTNATKVSEWISNCLPSTNLSTSEGLMHYMGRTIYQFIQDVTQSVGGVLLALPQKLGLQNGDDIVKMFNVYNYNADGWNEDKTTFLFLYAYKPSEHLGDNGSNGINGYKSDGFDINGPDEIIGPLASSPKVEDMIPAFGVTFGKQNQSLFKNLTLNTENTGTTEASIAATFNIVSKSSDGPRESNLYGQDLYKVYSQYSYQAEVEMMGCAQIMPMMYFELNNVPLWKGAYFIKKVTHDITPGNMVTKFVGQRINRNTIPISDGTVVNPIKELADEEKEDTSVTGTKSGTTEFVDNKVLVNSEGQPVTTGNGSNGSSIVAGVNIAGNPNMKIADSIDFNPANVTSKKPIICITPAHGPNTQKWQEWTWSTKMVDQYLIPMLKNWTYPDKTKFNIQRCNKGGNHTGSKGYSTVETQNIIKKYGSSNVISVVPHWNGCGANYHGTYVNKVSNGTREDSQKFAECMLAAVKATAEKRASYTQLPVNSSGVGAMDGMKYNRIQNLGENNTDGAPQLNCACILTENWFADFPKGCSWSSETKYAEKDGNRFKTMRGWLMSDEGCKTIAQMHVQGIVNYINSLWKK